MSSLTKHLLPELWDNDMQYKGEEEEHFWDDQQSRDDVLGHEGYHLSVGIRCLVTYLYRNVSLIICSYFQ